MQVHEITRSGCLDEGWMDTAKNAVAQGATAVKAVANSHFVAGLTGQDPSTFSNQSGATPTGIQPGETPDQILARVQNDPKIQQLIGNMEKEWATYIKANPALLNQSTPVPESASGYAPLPGSGIMVPNTVTKTVAPPPATSTANTAQQAQDSYKKAFGDWARSKLSSNGFDPTKDSKLTATLDQLADAATKNNAAGVSKAFKEYMNRAITAVQVQTAAVRNNTAPVTGSRNTAAGYNTPAPAGAADVTAVLQKANLTTQQLQALGRAVGIPTGQRVKNTGNEQLNNIIRVMGIQVLQ